MQIKFEYVLGDTGQNLIFIIKRYIDDHGRVICYETVESFRKYSTQKRFVNESSINAYIRSLKASD